MFTHMRIANMSDQNEDEKHRGRSAFRPSFRGHERKWGSNLAASLSSDTLRSFVSLEDGGSFLPYAIWTPSVLGCFSCFLVCIAIMLSAPINAVISAQPLPYTVYCFVCLSPLLSRFPKLFCSHNELVRRMTSHWHTSHTNTKKSTHWQPSG